MAVGLGLVGLAGYAFVAIVGRVFGRSGDPNDLTALTSVYLLTNIVGPGLYVALEQEVSRSVSHRSAMGRSVYPAAIRGALLGVAMSVIAALVLVALWVPALSRVLNDRVGLLAAVVLAVAGAGMAYWTRGVLSGQQRFVAYAGTLHLEGGTRLLGMALLLGCAVQAPEAYGFVFAAGAGLAGLAMLPTLRLGARPETTEPPDRMGRSLAFLVTSTLLMQLIANLGPVVVAYRLPTDAVAAGAFAATFVLARIPLFLFAPVQAMLLPALTRALVADDRAAFRRRVRQTTVIIAVFTSAGALLGGTIGPWAVGTLLGLASPPGPLVLVLLAVATGLLMVCQMLQPALVAAGRQRRVATAWVAGAVVFTGLLFAPVPPIQAALIAQLAGPAVTVALAGAALLVEARTTHPPTSAAEPGAS
jgi:O-antigen/teichoic acid export membrane protein